MLEAFEDFLLSFVIGGNDAAGLVVPARRSIVETGLEDSLFVHNYETVKIFREVKGVCVVKRVLLA